MSREPTLHRNGRDERIGSGNELVLMSSRISPSGYASGKSSALYNSHAFFCSTLEKPTTVVENATFTGNGFR